MMQVLGQPPGSNACSGATDGGPAVGAGGAGSLKQASNKVLRVVATAGLSLCPY